jgi:hypothetical protein
MEFAYVNALIESHFSQLVHLRATRSPWVIACCCPNFGLGITVALCVVLGGSQGCVTAQAASVACSCKTRKAPTYLLCQNSEAVYGT